MCTDAQLDRDAAASGSLRSEEPYAPCFVKAAGAPSGNRMELAPDIASEVIALAEMNGCQLRQRWATLIGSPAPGVSPKLLRLALAWHIQSDALGGLPASARRRLTQVAGGKSATQSARAGTRLVREWQGVVHVVTIDENGTVCWNAREWKSLSAVARAITGGHWSGPAFFGLRKPLPRVRAPDMHEAQDQDPKEPGALSKTASSRIGSSPRISPRGRTAG